MPTTTTIASGAGPVAAWALNEGAGGSVGDATGRGNNGTIMGATWRPQGRWGSALGFDGDDSVSVPDGADLDETSALTIEAWINPAQVSGYRMVVAKTSAGTPMNYYLGLSGREVEFGFFSSGAWRWQTTSGVDLVAGTWAHVAVVYSDAADSVRLYVNGAQRLAATETGTLTVNAQPLRIGLGYPNDGFIGDIDEVRVYQRALSASEIVADMNSPVGGGATPTTSTSTTSSSSSSTTAVVPSTTSTSRSTTTTSSSSTSSSSSTTTSSTSSTSTSSTSSTTSTTIPPDLVGGWGFDEGSGGVAFDESGLENDAGITGATFTPGGRFGGALSFDGNADWLTVADAGSLDLASEMTLEAWVYPTGSGTVARPIVGKERPSNAAWFLNAATAGNSNPSVAVRVGTSNVTATAGGPLAVNTWTHLAATYDGTFLRLYVNGSLAAERATSGVLATSSRPLRIGHNDVNGGVFLGRIDEVRVYARALTAQEIQADMARPVP